MAEKFNYYRTELDNLYIKDLKYPACVKISSESKATKHFSLNDESASELVKWLKENYTITDL